MNVPSDDLLTSYYILILVLAARVSHEISVRISRFNSAGQLSKRCLALYALRLFCHWAILINSGSEEKESDGEPTLFNYVVLSF